MFQIFAHRGLVEYPENSTLALQKALQAGFGIEMDIHRTKDAKLVVTHDSNLYRLYGYGKIITDLTLNQIKEISTKNHEIPTLLEVFNLFKKYAAPNAMAAVQIKESTEKNIAKLTLNAFEGFNKKYPKFGIFNRAFVFDSTKEVAVQIKKLQPKIKIALSVGEDRLFAQERYRKRYPTIYTLKEIANFKYFDIVWADEWQNGLYSKDFVKEIQEMNKLVFAVSPELHKDTEPSHPHSNDLEKIKKDWKNLIKWGFDGICTDYPTEIAKLIK